MKIYHSIACAGVSRGVVLAMALVLGLGAGFSARGQSVQVMHVFDNNVLMNADAVENVLVVAPDGTLYGTCPGGGAYGYGAIFSRATNGAVSTLYSFTGGADGATPEAGLTLGADGNYYGTTTAGGAGSNGVIFQITTNNSFTVIHTFAASMTNNVNANTNADG